MAYNGIFTNDSCIVITNLTGNDLFKHPYIMKVNLSKIRLVEDMLLNCIAYVMYVI